MSTLAWIILTSLLGGLISIFFAAILTLNTRSSWVSMLVSYAIGALLGAAFLNTLPEALELAEDPKQITIIVLLGILLFFILEKLVLWRHCHMDECEVHDPEHGHSIYEAQGDHGRSGLMITLGDTFHNFVDGILIAAAFMVDVQLGIVTAIAIFAHEVPQEAGDFIILLNSGYSRTQALLLNLLSSTSAVVGGVLAYFMLHQLNHLVLPMLAIATACMIYVAMADLIPGLHKRPEIGDTIQQVVLISLGIGSIWLVETMLKHSH
ncbi:MULTISPECIES: ZIP family metal transporter [Nitrosomonas]|jgi:zinc and cadmium transporter|uniref:ZIP zinc transporter n=1 Tax=Nitrosomonas communis TaxID=44574 RepID=A0A0F7KEE2_9PROT|nr:MULTISPECIES: ZIP family metal transporter [Nitrosomonas]AKH37503.1 ZIP zinc transporter [Nitrosomonas communis]TYP92337.1 zinc and cadmium transporter [Nitrosomonas communis]UVS62751.1 ZIP family metal transporter [Nitrosomonas sp. PLL12]SDW22448.1 zinc and cadmium transporter [Nitrosomonas communis]